MQNKRTPLAQGRIIKGGENSYEVIQLLGTGGSGLTYLCKRGSHTVAVKEVYPRELEHLIQRSEDGTLSFVECMKSQHTVDTFRWYQKNMRREAQLHQESMRSRNTLNNDPFFLGCEGVFDYNNTTYCVYHTAEGKTLNEHLRDLHNQADPEAFLESVLSTLAIASKKLACVHKADMLHLDLSPTNIYMIDHGDGPVPYLLDFGSACITKESCNLQEHRFSVTSGFSAPELYCRSEGNHNGYPVTAATDTYSLVAILFFALLERTYEESIWNNDIWENALKEKYPYSNYLSEIIKKGLGEQRNRYQSPNELCADLVRILEMFREQGMQTKVALANLDLQLEVCVQSIRQIIDRSTTIIVDSIHRSEENITKTTRTESKKTKVFFTWIATAAFVFLIACFAVMLFTDFEPPEFELLCSDYMNEESSAFEISGTLLEFCITAKDNKSLEDRTITENDIILNGFSAEKEFVDLYNGYYSIRLTSIQKIADTCSIQIREGCVKDNQGHKSAAKTIPVLFVNKAGDRTVPTIAMSHPTGTNGSNLIEAGANIVIKLWLSDNEKLSRENVSAEYIHAVGFTYDEMIVHGNNGEYTITFSRVRGATGRYYIYVAPGIAVDGNKNYSFGIKSSEFYLYNEKSEIDTSAPALTISSATVTGNTVEYHIAANDNVGLYSFMLRPEDITLVGFSANIIIEYESTSSVTQSVRIIRFTNVVSTSSNPQKYFILNSGIAKDAFGNQTKAKISPVFDCPE